MYASVCSPKAVFNLPPSAQRSSFALRWNISFFPFLVIDIRRKKQTKKMNDGSARCIGAYISFDTDTCVASMCSLSSKLRVCPPRVTMLNHPGQRQRDDEDKEKGIRLQQLTRILFSPESLFVTSQQQPSTTAHHTASWCRRCAYVITGLLLFGCEG